jgi:hypothetical protein
MTTDFDLPRTVSSCEYRGGTLRLVRQQPFPDGYDHDLPPDTYGVNWEIQGTELRVGSLDALAAATAQQPIDTGGIRPEDHLELARIFAELIGAGRVVDDLFTVQSAAPRLEGVVQCPRLRDRDLVFTTTQFKAGGGLDFVEWSVDLGNLSHRRLTL